MSPAPLHPLSSAASPGKSFLAALLILSTTLGVFFGVVQNQFTWWDDSRTIHHNNQFNPPTREGILQTWKKPAYGLYVPLTYTYWGALAFAAEKQPDEFGIHLDPRIYHAASLLLHLAAVLVAFAILRLLGGRLWPSAAGAMLFAIHPVQVEPVAWASGAKDLLAGLLSLCAIHQYLVWAQMPSEHKLRRATYFISGIALAVLAMLAKPSAIVTPLLIALLDGLILRHPWKRVALSAGAFAIAILPLAIIAKIVQTADGVADVTWWQKPLIAADAIAFYLGKLLWPMTLAPDYGRRPSVVLNLWHGWWPALIWLVPATLTLITWRVRKTRPAIWTGWLIFLAALLPVLGLVPFMFQYMSTVADHYLYLAMLGPALIVTTILSTIQPGPHTTQYATRNTQSHPSPCPLVPLSPCLPLLPSCLRAFVPSCLLLLAALRTISQIQIWHDDRTLWTHTLAHCPDSFVAPNNLATNLGRTSVLLEIQAEAAAEKSQPRRAEQLQHERRQTLTQAIALLNASLRINPDYPAARHNAVIYSLRIGDIRSAASHIEAMIAADPRLPAHMRDDPTPWHDTAGMIRMKLGQYQQAADHFRALLAINPNHPTAKDHLAQAESKLQETRVE